MGDNRVKEITPEHTRIASYIKKARNKLGLEQTDFGRACGLRGRHCGRTVSRWEHAELQPSGPVLAMIKSMLDKHRRQIQVQRRAENQKTCPQEGQV